MPHEILNTMRTLREDMRQRLLQLPEYRALVALDRSIEEISEIMGQAMGPAEASTPAPEPAPGAETPPPPAARPNSIASAFAETLAARIDQRQARAANTSLQAQRALCG